MHSTAIVKSCVLVGVSAELVDVHCLVEPGSRALNVAGATVAASKEASIRILSALAAIDRGGHCRISVGFGRENAPTRMVASLDLAGAIGVLAALGDVPGEALAGVFIVGELGLDGSVRAVRGTLAAAELARSEGASAILVPESCAWEATLVEGLAVHPIANLAEAVAVLRGERPPRAASVAATRPATDRVDMSEVRGIPEVVDAVADAVAERQDILLVGPPGTGKTMLARRVGTLLAELTPAEALEVTRVYSALGLASEPCQVRPFRAPHHTISTAGLIGDAHSSRRPGELQLASCGVLYLDEIAEFSPSAVHALAATLRQMPSRPVVVASANPCPCGWLGHPSRACVCSPSQVERYQAHTREISDTLGLTAVIEVPMVTLSDLRRAPAGKSSAELRARVASPASAAPPLDASVAEASS